jgi:DNA invertase Pin-like site-specific DNA recombinase
MRAVVYARYSSDHQREASIEDQVRVCRDHIKNHGCTFVSCYTDRALSGASTLRPGYQQLLQDARAGTFDIVVAEALDRLSRDQEDVAGLYKQLSFLGIGIVTLAEGEINELHVGLKGTMNALYLKDLAQKTRRGLEGRVRQGKSGGGLCYGYDVVRATDEAGEPVHGERRINEIQAAVVRRIFQEFAAGKSPRAIARGLNAEDIPGPRGRAWRDTAIRGHVTRGTGILNNELYLGRLVWNRQRYVKDPSTGKRLARRNPECKWIIEEVPELRIVDDDLWDQVKRRQRAIAETPGVRKLKASAFWTRRRARHLLTGLVVCGACGGRFASVGRDYLACSAARGRGTCSNRRSLKRSNLEGIILEGLKAKLMAPELVKEFIAAFHEEVNRQGRTIDLERRSKERELSEVSRRLDGLIEAIADGLRTPGLKAKLEQLEELKARLEQELAAPHTPAPRLHPNLAEVYRQKVANLHEALQVPETRDEALTILRGLVEQVVLHARDDGFEIVLVGEIAQMIEFSAETEGSHFDPYRSSVKVVAGVGFEPTTFRL